MKQWLVKKVVGWFGGVTAIVEIALNWFNEEVLGKCKDKDEMAAYCTDIEELAAYLNGVFERHSKWMSDDKRNALKATVDAVKELAAALKDANVTSAELDSIIDKVKAAMDAWLNAK